MATATSNAAQSNGTIESALLAAQGEFPEIPKDKENKYYNTRYASLDAIVSATRPALAKNALLMTHRVDDTDSGVRVTAILKHITSGGEISTSLSCECIRSEPQKLGSVITYLRRYTLAALLGVTPDEDDDGNATKSMNNKQPRENGKKQQPTTRKEQDSFSPPPTESSKPEFKPPPGWPNTPAPQIMAWLDKGRSTSGLKVALGMFVAEPSLYSNVAEWEPVIEHVAKTYKRLTNDFTAHRDEALEAEITKHLEKVALDKAGAETFQKQEATT